jgi:hypothetical protein
MTDEDNDITNATEYDDIGRPIKAITAQGTALEYWTITEYHDTDRFVVVKSDIEAKGEEDRGQACDIAILLIWCVSYGTETTDRDRGRFVSCDSTR